MRRHTTLAALTMLVLAGCGSAGNTIQSQVSSDPCNWLPQPMQEDVLEYISTWAAVGGTRTEGFRYMLDSFYEVGSAYGATAAQDRICIEHWFDLVYGPPAGEEPRCVGQTTTIAPGIYTGTVMCDVEEKASGSFMVQQSTYGDNRIAAIDEAGLLVASTDDKDTIELSGTSFHVTWRTCSEVPSKAEESIGLSGVIKELNVNGSLVTTVQKADNTSIRLVSQFRLTGGTPEDPFHITEHCEGLLVQ